MDPIIRQEIKDEMYVEEGYSSPKWQEHIVLLTRDLMMACSASAEEIDTFYFCSAKPEKREFKTNVNGLVKIIIEVAVTFGRIRIEGFYDNRSLIFEGMWSGKNVMDWYKERLMVEEKM